MKPSNLHAAPLHVLHAELQRFSQESDYRSLCPCCKAGVLLVSRNQETFALTRLDRCTYCAQLFVYEDTTIAGEEVEPLADEILKKIYGITN